MRAFPFLLFSSALFGLYNNVAAQKQDEKQPEKKWVCTVPSHAQLISFYYTGGDWAQIHIAPYSSGGSYKVTKVDGVATGTTANGTEFTCKQA